MSARPGDTVYYAAGDFGPLTVFRVSCPRGLARSWPKSLAPLFDVTLAVGFPVAFYVARDREGTGARRLRFPVLLENGKRRLVTTLPIGAEADRDRTAAPGTSPPWIDAQWKPAARPDICKISAVWRIAGRRAELRRWRVAPKCNLGGPVYEIRLDRGVPDLAGD